MSQPVSDANPTARRSRWIRRAALATVVLVPLAFAGLFVGALSQSDDALKTIPAAIVNDDSLITQTADDGTETNIFAGRQLVTELTGGDSTGFDWTITNADDAKEALANGEVYAILTVPSNFSKSIVSIQGDDPVKADFSIRTDDAHSYITGAVAQVVGEGMASAFGAEITQQYIEGIYASIGDVGGSLQDAADGASDLADGADDLTDGAESLSDGLSTLADGTGSASDGASQLSDGVSTYTDGVGQLSDGLTKLAKGDNALTDISTGVTDYTKGVTKVSGGLDDLNDVIQAYPTIDAQTKAAMQQLTTGLGTISDSGPALRKGAKDGISAIQSAITQSASGAKKLDGGSAALVTGASGLADGLSELDSGATSASDGASTLATGAGKLADGAGTLADGLSDGAEQVPSMDDAESAASAEVVADPVTYTVTTDNAVTDVGQAVSTFFVPLGLWIGALAIFLVLRPATRRSLVSTAGNRRVVFSTLGRAAIVTAIQAVLLVALLHVAVGVDWSLLPATLPFALLVAVAFTAFHHLLSIWLGRGGLVVSLFVLALQLAATGGIYPIELVAPPFQAVSPFLPLTWAVAGLQGIIVGGSTPAVLGAVALLAGLAVVSVLLSLVAIRRSRRAAALGFAPKLV
jgi:putative membrane protein